MSVGDTIPVRINFLNTFARKTGMSDENYGFCPHCGENLKTDSVYCPACGAIIKPEEAKATIAASRPTSMGGTRLFSFVLLIIYTIVELMGSVSMLSFSPEMYDTLDQMFIESLGESFADWMYSNLGVVITKEQFLSETFIIGIVGLLSAVAAGVSAYFCYKRENRMYAVIACAASTLIAMSGAFLCPLLGGGISSAIFTLLVGGLVTFLIYRSDKYFAA